MSNNGQPVDHGVCMYRQVPGLTDTVLSSHGTSESELVSRPIQRQATSAPALHIKSRTWLQGVKHERTNTYNNYKTYRPPPKASVY